MINNLPSDQFKKSAVLLVFLLTLSACTENGQNNNQVIFIDFSNYPIMQCQIVFSNGNFFGYQPPQKNDSLSINLSQLLRLKKLQFNSNKGSYIPLLEPLQIEKVTSISKTAFIDLRLLSIHKNGQRILLDIEQYDTSNSVNSKVWIVEENKIVKSIALLDCTFKKEIN